MKKVRPSTQVALVVDGDAISLVQASAVSSVPLFFFSSVFYTAI